MLAHIQCKFTPATHWRRITVRCGSCHITLNVRWLWVPNSICLSYSYLKRTEPFTDREGDTFPSVQDKKVHQFLYGRTFTLLTDHKPLTSIFGPKCGIPPLAGARMQRWALLLLAYSYTTCFRPTQAHGNADALSRLPTSDTTPVGNPSDPSVFNMAQIDSLPLGSAILAGATKADPVLSVVLKFLHKGWPTKVPDDVLPYRNRRDDPPVEGDCILWGIWVVIPASLEQQILQELHQGHPGVVCMKSSPKPCMVASSRQRCGADGKGLFGMPRRPPKAPLHPWTWPTSPMERIHVDYAGPVQGKMLSVMYDEYSKWVEVYSMASTTSTSTITVLRETFAHYGLPK